MTLGKEQLIILSCKKNGGGEGRGRERKNMKENVVALYVKCLLMNP